MSYDNCSGVTSINSEVASEGFNQFLSKSFNVINPGKKFVNNWHLDVICHYLSELSKGNINRLLINMPPRALKSFSVNVCWPAWLMGNNPAVRIISALSLIHI